MNVRIDGDVCAGTIITKVLHTFSLVPFRSYEDPTPSYRVLADGVSTFISAVQRSLKLGVNRACTFTLELRTDVFRYLFKGKGNKPPTRRGLFYELVDFDSSFFPFDWYVVYDKLGNGCRIDFPVRLNSRVNRTTVVYNKIEDGSLVPKPRAFTEMISVNLVKSRC